MARSWVVVTALVGAAAVTWAQDVAPGGCATT